MRYVEYEKRLSILIEKFDAEIIPKEKVLHLKRSDQVDYRYVFAVLNISHPDKLTALFTQEEKLEHQEDVEDNIKHPFDLSNVEPGTEDYVQWGIDWMEGRLITLALESKDGEYISEW
ncbi:hypothetical protein [Gracilibacillus alcaliphilus]|uniref:hypothetical protein n=1 Tax=Gracilibacillus alcaliphilus TaxID=1401441 RepID=UPI00195F1BB6|nr:hypothetical protein [Gracilibacillus alcaliphilus]MBM7678114.1 hypothetical protein [Gracilibacillus alcaliphilus]